MNQGSAAPGMARATLHDLGALSHRSDQGRRATDACPGPAFRVRVLLNMRSKSGGAKNEGERRKRRQPVSAKHLTSRDKLPRTTTGSVRKRHRKFLTRLEWRIWRPVAQRGGTRVSSMCPTLAFALSEHEARVSRLKLKLECER